MMRLRIVFGLMLLAYSLFAAAQQVVIKTSLGDIVIELNAEAAPATVENFLSYVDRDAFDNTIFHRVIPGFMVQGGGYYADLSEADEGDPVMNEAANGLKNVRGTVAMARQDEIDSARRNFFINVANNRSLNHHKRSCTREDEASVAAARKRGVTKPVRCKNYGYAVFGKVVTGMDIVDLIEVTDTQTVGEFDDVPVAPIVIFSIDRVDAEAGDSSTTG